MNKIIKEIIKQLDNMVLKEGYEDFIKNNTVKKGEDQVSLATALNYKYSEEPMSGERKTAYNAAVGILKKGIKSGELETKEVPQELATDVQGAREPEEEKKDVEKKITSTQNNISQDFADIGSEKEKGSEENNRSDNDDSEIKSRIDQNKERIQKFREARDKFAALGDKGMIEYEDYLVDQIQNNEEIIGDALDEILDIEDAFDEKNPITNFTGQDYDGAGHRLSMISLAARYPDGNTSDFRVERMKKRCEEKDPKYAKDCENYSPNDTPTEKDIEAFKRLQKNQQQSLVDMGLVDEDGMVTVYRGAGGVEGEGSVDYKGSAVDSWSMSPTIAWSYAEVNGGKNIMKVKVPLDRVIMAAAASTRDQFEFPSEFEVTIDSIGLDNVESINYDSDKKKIMERKMTKKQNIKILKDKNGNLRVVKEEAKKIKVDINNDDDTDWLRKNRKSDKGVSESFKNVISNIIIESNILRLITEEKSYEDFIKNNKVKKGKEEVSIATALQYAYEKGQMSAPQKSAYSAALGKIGDAMAKGDIDADEVPDSEKDLIKQAAKNRQQEPTATATQSKDTADDFADIGSGETDKKDSEDREKKASTDRANDQWSPESRQSTIDQLKTRDPKLAKAYETMTKDVEEEYKKLDDEGKQELSKVMTLVDKSFLGSEEQRSDSLFELFNSHDAGVSENRAKFYLNSLRKFGGDYKLLGQSGNAGTKALVSLAEKYLDASQLGSGGDDKLKQVKQSLTTAAKPELESSADLYEKQKGKFTDEIANPELEKIFNTPPLDRIDNKKFQSIFCPIVDGKPLVPSGGKNSKAYLEQSISENTSLDATIDVARREVEAGNLNPDFLSALEEHKEKMQDVLKMKIPSDKASQAVSDSYATLFTKLHQADEEMAPAVLKQFAEMSLYDSELAKGDQAYLPKDGSFPAGDKLVISNTGEGSTELVSFISVKYGKSGDVYGCPANASALQALHPDEEKRDVLGSYVGQPGYTLAIKDELIENPSAYIRENLKEQMESDSSLKGLFSDDEIEEIGNVISEYKELVDKFLEKNTGKDRWAALQKYLNKDSKVKKLNDRLKKVATQEKMAKLVGKANANSRFNNNLNAATFISVLGATNQIRTSDGYKGVEHNKQYIDEGKAKSSTIPGENDMDKWYLAPRMYRTPGRNGGGIQLSFIGDELAQKGEILGILPSDKPPKS